MAAVRSSVFLHTGSGLNTREAPNVVARINLKATGFKHTRLICPGGRWVLPSRRYQAVKAEASSKDHSQLVKDSWQILKKEAVNHAAAFFLKIFEIAPTVKPMFSFMRDSDLPAEKNPQLKAHALVVFTMTCEAALLLGEDPTLSALRPKLLEMGQTHVGHKVLDEHFDVVRYALLETLKDALKENWTPDMKAVWGEAYDAVTSVIKEEMHAIRAASPSSTA